MAQKHTDKKPLAADKTGVAKLRAELEGRTSAKRETKPFVAHGGKPPAPPSA